MPWKNNEWKGFVTSSAHALCISVIYKVWTSFHNKSFEDDDLPNFMWLAILAVFVCQAASQGIYIYKSFCSGMSLISTVHSKKNLNAKNFNLFFEWHRSFSSREFSIAHYFYECTRVQSSASKTIYNLTLQKRQAYLAYGTHNLQVYK